MKTENKEPREKKNAREDKHLQKESKQPYETPQLTVHGTVEEITQLAGGTPNDGQTGSQIP